MRWLAPLLLVASAHLFLTACTEYGLGDGLRPVEDPIPGAADGETPWWEDPWAEPPEDAWSDPINENGVGDPGDLEGFLFENDDDGDGVPDEDDDDDDGDGVADEDEGATTPDGVVLDGAARMTGGGVADGASHGFTVHCAFTHHANSVEINVDGSAFHLEDVEWVVCLDDPDVEPEQPLVGFDTVVGVGWGRLDGEDAAVWFRFSDDGEPGTTDEMAVEIENDAAASSHAGRLVGGNHQAHGAI